MEITAPASPTPKAAMPAHPRRLRAFLRPLAWALIFCALSLAGAGIAVTLFGAQTYHWRAFDLEVGVQPAARGETRLIFAPLGEVRAPTHKMPLALQVGLRGIAFDEMKQLILKPPPRNALEREFERAAGSAMRRFAWRQVTLGALGALVVPLLFRFRRLREWLLCALWGGVFVAAALFFTLRGYDRRAFDSPTYTGSLRQANWIIALVKDAFSKADALSNRLERVAGNLNTLYGRINAVPGLAADVDTIKVLHISDIHNNPASIRFVQELVGKMRIDLVIDTGDLTDFGSPLETSLARSTAHLGVPYLFVAGNHDSQETVQALRAWNPNAVVLDYQPVTAAGLSVLGGPDPASARPGPGSVDTSTEALEAAAERMRNAFRSAAVPPDIVAVHNPLQAERLRGVAPLILSGHLHRAFVETSGGTTVCNAGTTGAAGARYLDRPGGVPFTAAILSFSRATPPRLLFVDQVTLDGTLDRYSISRRAFNGDALPHEAGATGGP